MSHRIREAMRSDDPGFFGRGGGIVEADETFTGIEPGVTERKAWHHKMKVLALVEQGGLPKEEHWWVYLTALLVGYGAWGMPVLAVKTPIFLAYFIILAARPMTSSTRLSLFLSPTTATVLPRSRIMLKSASACTGSAPSRGGWSAVTA